MDRVAFKCLKRFILALALLIVQHSCNLFVDGVDTLSMGASLRGHQTITSKNGTFQLGFFNPNGTNNWYVGIWYAHIPDQTVIWVANRETPIKNMPGVFTLSKSGYLTVSDLQREVVWSTNDTQRARASMASILDTGNFVLLGAQNSSQTVWESFENPTDHFLPTMKLWKGLKLNSWKSSVDPAPGPFFLQMNPSPGKNNFMLHYRNGVSYYSTGEWTGSYFTTIPGAKSDSIFSEELVVFSPTRMYYTYGLTPKAGPIMAREVLQSNGDLSVYFWLHNNSWSLVWFQPQPSCGVYGVCGAYGVCFTQTNIQLCDCPEGFQPRDSIAWRSHEWWSSGCVRRTPLNCSDSTTTEDFVQLTDKSLSDEESVQYAQESTVQGCRTSCLNNCSCTAFAFTDSNIAVCKLWFGDLLSLQATSSGGQPFFIRLAASDVSQLSANTGRSSSSSRVVALYIAIPLGVAVLSCLFIGAWFIQRRRTRLEETFMKDDASTLLINIQVQRAENCDQQARTSVGKGSIWVCLQRYSARQ